MSEIRPTQNRIYRLLREHPALLGTTSQFVFLYEAETGRVDILPNESVRAITICAPRQIQADVAKSSLACTKICRTFSARVSFPRRTKHW